MRLETLKSHYAASISTLREALYRLTSEGLVVVETRGFEVAPLSTQEFVELAALRELLETRAMRQSFAAGTLEWEGQVVGSFHKLNRMEQLMLSGDRSRSTEWKQYDREFHRTLISACASQELLAAHAAIFDRFQRYQIVAVIFRGEAAAAEHEALRQAALDRRIEDAESVLHRHIQGCIEHSMAQGLLDAALPDSSVPGARPREPRRDADLSVGERGWRQVRGDILMGRLLPRQKLRLDSLRASYGVSISTLREILNRLTSEGLVIAEGQRGFEVAPVSAANLHEIAQLRLLLEGQALEDSFAAGDVEWEAQLVAAYHRLVSLEERMAANDRSAAELWKQYDWQFHQALISACGSQMLMQLHGAIFDKYLRYQMIALSYRGRIAADEHRALHDCALRRDAAGARAVLEQHLQGGVSHALMTGTFDS
ncbi:DNA-binding transcriptional regulator, GntR family [Paracoccus tibetensis]|uniref:DNA-binding transcriptional regulator, GntR family n=2 Tax=Paracoccus tibetensis TaxID=336292 RepID=A0A1G5K398_9RHOB|nr:DNA-binding transcriptional regulator, GntR family [Paracoccus tibetensis]